MKTLLVCVDFSDTTDKVVETAARLARAMQAELCLIYVVPLPVVVPEDLANPVQFQAEDLRRARERLAAIADRTAAAGLTCDHLLLEGTPGTAIVDEAQRRHVDMIVMGSHGHGALYHLLLGGTSQAVLHKAACPVLIVPSHRKGVVQPPPTTPAI